MSRPTTHRARRLLASGAVMVTGVGAVGLLAPVHALAAVSLTVTTTVDIAAGAGDCGSASTVVPSSLSLREATCIANNYKATQPVTISVPAGTYTLTSGQLQLGKVPGSNITVTGAGSASTIIDGNLASRVLDLDPQFTGGVTTTIDGVTITKGRDGTSGGAGIWDGSSSSPDVLTVTNSVISSNQANFASPNTTTETGAGIQFDGGSMTLTNDTFSGNQSFSSAGSAVYYETDGTTAAQALTVTGSTFTGNATANTGGSGTSGGALAVATGSGSVTGKYTVTDSTFTGNTATSSTAEGATGGAIFQESGSLTVTGSTFTANSVSGSGATGGPVLYTAAGTATLHYNRFTGNTGTGGLMTKNSAISVNATDNWWGCTTGPGGAGCDTVSGTGITTTPRLVLAATATPAHVVGPNGTASLSASLLTDSSGGTVSGSALAPAFDGLPVSFSDPSGDATVTLTAGVHSANLTSGVASIDYHSNTTLGPDNDTVTLDNGAVTAVLEVDQPPVITSANSANFTVGSAGSFTVTTTGYPAVAISKTGSLPSGLTFHDNGDGSATISGTPGAGTGGTYPLNLTANNGYAPNATQTLTVSVAQPPKLTSASTATFAIGSASSFTVATSGAPTVSTITESGILPAGITFTDNGNGTATVAGTPTGTGNTYPVTLTATNGVSPDASQNLTLQVNQAPGVTQSPANQTVQPGTSVSFTAAAAGVPTPTVQWQRSSDRGASFANIAGATSTTYTFTAALGDDGNLYRAVFSNGVGSPATTTYATLSVGTAPSFTSADHISFLVGQAGSVSLTTTGVPSATLSRTGGQFPAWLTLTDNGDGTGTLTGTPPAGSAGQYQFTLKAANGFSPSSSQTFALSVDDSPVITSADHTTFTVGTAGSFAVTASAGYPTTTTITESGSLPSGVTLHDNGDGTATLAGTPAAGTGGKYPVTMTATASGGLAAPAMQSYMLTVQAPPEITSADHTTFTVGTAGSLTVTTTAGTPASTTISESGSLPSGVTITDNGDGTATVAGTPAAGTGGVYTLAVTAGNGVAPDATQSLTLTVEEPPSLTSADHTTFTMGMAGTFSLTTNAGQPSSTIITETGSLPAGVTFTDNGDGTATLAGTAAAGTNGSYLLTITAANGVLPNDTQSLDLTVDAAPTITSVDHTTVPIGGAAAFTVTTTPGTPGTTAISENGALPSGMTFADNGDGTATLAGTPAAGSGGAYPLTITASNGVLPDPAQSFTLTVTDLPLVTSADHTTFTVSTAGSLTVTTLSGYPSATSLSATGTLPSGVSFTDNGDGTATVQGTPAAGAAGAYPLTLTAANSAGHTTQAFTLTVMTADQTVTVTSADPGNGTVGGSYTPTSMSTSGLPMAYAIDASTTNQACSFDGTVVHFDHAGICVVDFDQPGSTTYAPAPTVRVTVAVDPIGTTGVVAGSVAAPVYGQAFSLTAQSATATAWPAGTVQFSLDGAALGAPVTVTAGRATSPTVGLLSAGGHTIGATFVPADSSVYAGDSASGTVVVTQAASTTTVVVDHGVATVTVAPVTPGAGVPTGSVAVTAAGRPVGTVALTGGTATISVPPAAGGVAVVYSGDSDFTGSSASTTGHNPRIVAVVSSGKAKSRLGWYRTPVTVRFVCTAEGSAVSGPCPAPVLFTHNGAAQVVTRTITSVDGGIATVTVRGINIDRSKPTVHIVGISKGTVYGGAAPKVRCAARDALSGLVRCTITRKTVLGANGPVTTVVATAVDKAGNTAIARATYRTMPIYLAGATFRNGEFEVKLGHAYTLVVFGGQQPRYEAPSVFPYRPDPAGPLLHHAGKGRWTLGLVIDKGMPAHRLWNLGAMVGGKLYVIKVRML